MEGVYEMKTNLGLYLKELRKKHNEKLQDMAAKLGVSAAFLSGVENGKKSMPDAMYSKLCILYKLDLAERITLEMCIAQVDQMLKLNFKEDLPKKNQELAVVFSKTFDKLDEKKSEKLIEYLLGNQIVFED